MIPISVCIIAKNEEKYIGECLQRLSCFDWEIILVDTGSTDRTLEIAQRFTPNIFHYSWTNDFSAARNYSVSKASYDYILAVDCDEYLEINGAAHELIPHLTEIVSPTGIGMLNRLSPSFALESSSLSVFDAEYTVHEQIARFFNRKHTHFTGSIHEQLVSLKGLPLQFIPVPLTFYHTGYCTMDIKKEKAVRNISMLKADLNANGSHPYTYFQLGQSYFGLSDYENALIFFEKGLSMDCNIKEEYVQTMVESYGYCLLYLKKFQKALELENVYKEFSNEADFLFLMGLIYMNNGLFDKAVDEFLKAASTSSFSVEGVNSYKAFYNIGVIYECLGDNLSAIKYYSKCGDYKPALARLQELGIR